MLYMILFLATLNLSFADYVAESKFNECNNVQFLKKDDCENHYKEQCLKKTGETGLECGIYAISDILEDDLTKPIRNKTETTVCVEGHETDGNGEIINPEIPTCLEAMTLLTCPNEEKFINETQTEAYCSAITSYEQKIVGKTLVVDQQLKAQKDAENAQKLAMENAMASAIKAMECGKTIQALLLVRNAPKQLTTTQIKQMVQVYAPIKQLLDTGSLVSAKEEIQAVTADGVLVTEADKIALMAEIDKCLGI